MDVQWFQDPAEMRKAAARLVLESAKNAIARQGVFNLVLSGGETPKSLYEALARPPYSLEIPWALTHIFWGDERCVPPTDPASNYRLAQESLLSKVPIPQANIHRMPGETRPPESGAQSYEKILHAQLKSPSSLDLVLLGLGPDGHTASLFPGEPALEEKTRWVAATKPQGSPLVPRLTMTLPLIDGAQTVLFLVDAQGKERILQRIVGSPAAKSVEYPAGRVSPQGRLLWFIAQ